MNFGVMFIISRIVCKTSGKHRWRRARRNEPQDRKYCVRCHIGADVKRRKAAA